MLIFLLCSYQAPEARHKNGSSGQPSLRSKKITRSVALGAKGVSISKRLTAIMAAGNNAATEEDVVSKEKTSANAEGSPTNTSSDDSFSMISNDMGTSGIQDGTINVLDGPGVEDGRMGDGVPAGDYDLDESTDTLADEVAYQCTFHGQLHRSRDFKLELEAKVEEEELYKPDPAKFPSKAWRMGCWKSSKAEWEDKVCT